MTAAPGAWRRAGALGVMVASGFAGLGLQIVWTQQAATWLGHEAPAVLAVVTAFFGGLALGALTLGARIERSTHPARWYAACEAAIAIWTGVLALAMAPVSAWLLGATGAQPSPGWQWTVALAGTFLLLLPATAAMGATLPAMERVLAQMIGPVVIHPVAAGLAGLAGLAVQTGHASPTPGAVSAAGADLPRPPASLAALYASNTLGAVLGVLASAFWLVPQLGLARTAAVCAACNLGCAAFALMLTDRPAHGAPAAATADPRSAVLARPALRWMGLMTATGLLGIGYEVLVVRVISQVTENTVYTFAILLAVYLVGTTLGAAAYQRGWSGDTGHVSTETRRAPGCRLLLALAAACLLGTGSLWAAQYTRQAIEQAMGAGMGAALAAEATLALAAFALPTAVMGALFSHLSTQAQAAGLGWGRALGCNTLGAAAAPLLFGVWLVPALGAKWVLCGVAAGYLALAARQAWRGPALWLLAGAGAVLAFAAPPLVFIDIPEGGRVLSYREGAMAAVSVVEDADGVAGLRIDNRQQEGSSATLLADARQALLPLLLHPAPQRVLFLGLGTGVTASAAAADPTLRVDAAELLPEVIAASAFFTGAPGTAGAAPNPRLHVVAADARRYVRATDVRYDIVVSDNFHPARSGSGALYTVEHFQAVRDRLAPGGLFCQWLPLHQLDLASLRSIVQAFRAVYPEGTAMLATNSLQTPVLGLLARADARRPDLAALRQRLQSTALPQPLADFGIGDEIALLGGFVAGPAALAQFAGDAPLNTDDHPVVAYRAPRITYAPDSTPADRLVRLLQQWQVAPADVIDTQGDATGAARLAAYWVARDAFIEAGRDVRPAGDVRAMLAQVRAPLLAVLRTSPDFRPAYDPLLRMAAALGPSDAAAARALLTELATIQPLRPEAVQLLRDMDGAAR